MNDELESQPLTQTQVWVPRKLLSKVAPIDHLTHYQAAGQIAIQDPKPPWRGKPATARQEDFLRLRGLWRDGMTRGEASDIIGEVKMSGG